uniref:40S ribosomal protein S25 n=1 Tax=Lotus japonicus TaxID=34305 RepID=I3SE23_LOTJA|nr:unknown [Lotus japonicus]
MAKVKEKKTKEQIAKAAAAGGRSKKKKWSKGKSKEKANNAVVFDKELYDKLLKEVPTSKLITISSIIDKLRINGSLARRALRELAAKDLIRPVALSHAQFIYTRSPAAAKIEAAKSDAKADAKPAKGGKGKQNNEKEAAEPKE